MVDRITKESIFERLRLVMKHHDERNPIKLTDRLTKDLGFDSLELLELVMEIETVFKVEFDDDDVEKVSTIEDLVTLIEHYVYPSLF